LFLRNDRNFTTASTCFFLKLKLTFELSNDASQPFIHEKIGEEHIIKYLKKIEIADTEKPDNKLFFNF